MKRARSWQTMSQRVARPFRGPERRLCGAAFAYACAYTARCGHAIDATAEREHPGSFGALVAREGLRLLEV